MGMARPPRRDEGEEDVDAADEEEEEEGDATALVTIVRLLPEEEEAAEPETSRLWGIARERCIARERVELGGRGIQLERLRGRKGERNKIIFRLFFFSKRVVERKRHRRPLAFSSQPRPPVFFLFLPASCLTLHLSPQRFDLPRRGSKPQSPH